MSDPIYNTRAWRDVRALVMLRDAGACQIDDCGEAATAVDHIVPWREGGSWYDPSNLRAACLFHNSQRVKRPSRVGSSERRTSRDW